jgi:hypothetical protein
MVDTTRIADNIDGLADREFKTGGMKLSFGSIVAIFAFLSTVVGGLYGGFVMYQKIEEVAGLDLGEYQQAMDVMDAKVTGISEKVEEPKKVKKPEGFKKQDIRKGGVSALGPNER